MSISHTSKELGRAKSVDEADMRLMEAQYYAHAHLRYRHFTNGHDNSKLLLYVDIAAWMRFARTLIDTGSMQTAAEACADMRRSLMTACRDPSSPTEGEARNVNP